MLDRRRVDLDDSDIQWVRVIAVRWVITTLTSYIIVNPSQWHYCCSSCWEEKGIIDQVTIAKDQKSWARTRFYGRWADKFSIKDLLQSRALRLKSPHIFARFYTVNYKLELTGEWYAAEQVWKFSKSVTLLTLGIGQNAGHGKARKVHTVRWRKMKPKIAEPC